MLGSTMEQVYSVRSKLKTQAEGMQNYFLVRPQNIRHLVPGEYQGIKFQQPTER